MPNVIGREYVKETFKYRNKYEYVKVIQVKLPGMPWEDVTEYKAEDWKDAIADLEEYKASGYGNFRMITRRNTLDEMREDQ